jgi:GNAT superfamily N-acetyltransferase
MNHTPEHFHPSSDDDLAACFQAFLALRPHLSLEAFTQQVRRQQAQGYRIVAVQAGGQVLSAAGYRFAEFLAWGKVLYIDDLTTLESARGQGHAGALLDWLIGQARQQGCSAVHLDSGHHRHAAHRLYLNKGFVLSSHHFALAL